MIFQTSEIIPVKTETTEPLEFGHESWRWCRDCAAVTSGMCWKHSVRYLIIPQEVK